MLVFCQWVGWPPHIYFSNWNSYFAKNLSLQAITKNLLPALQHSDLKCIIGGMKGKLGKKIIFELHYNMPPSTYVDIAPKLQPIKCSLEVILENEFCGFESACRRWYFTSEVLKY